MAFGGVAIDQIGPTRDFPATSMLTGLIGNALGWHWSEGTRHQAIQNRIIFAARREREGELLTDTQNAQLEKKDKGWTTSGEPEGRDGASYAAPHRRQRDYHTDLSLRVVLRLEPAGEKPTLDEVADAFNRPARPLFLGRKPCLPSTPLLAKEPARWVSGDTAHQALQTVPRGELDHREPARLRALWPIGEGPHTGDGVDCIVDLPDLRNWRTGLHGGSRRVVQGWIAPTSDK